MNAVTATSLAAKADPPLNPNQPNQSNPVPNKMYGTFVGLLSSPSLRLPRNIAPLKAAKPAEICTTVPLQI